MHQAARLGLTSAQSTTVRDVVVDADGSQHVRYDRTYRQLPVSAGTSWSTSPPGLIPQCGPGHRASHHRADDHSTVKAPEAADLATAACAP